jgi:hypothetical protein
MNSIFISAQSASVFLVISIFWFYRRIVENKKKSDYIFFFLSIIFLILSPTVTGVALLAMGCVVYIILFNADKKIRVSMVKLFLLVSVLFLGFLYYYIDTVHGLDAFVSQIFLPNIQVLSQVPFERIIFGYGIDNPLMKVNEIALLSLLLKYGIVGFSLFTYLFLFLPITADIEFDKNNKIYVLMVILMFASLIHYNSVIVGGFSFLYIIFISILLGKLTTSPMVSK